MSEFFNIIPSGDTAVIMLYGDICDRPDSPVRSEEVAAELIAAEALYENIDIRINSRGGSVFEGIAIFNAIRQSKANITIYIDGIAASIASVIALCGKPVQMSKYARLMIHGVSGGVYGTKQDLQKYLENIESLEDTLCEIYAKRISKSKEFVKEMYFDGKDHWLGAEEALELGFIDAIFDVEPIKEGATNEEIYKTFNNRLKEPQIKEDMNFEKIKKVAGYENCASEDDILRKIQEGEKAHASLKAERDNLAKENATFKAADEQRAVAARTALLNAAEKDGRINATTRPTYQALLEADEKNGIAALEALPKKRLIADDLQNHGGGAEPTAFIKRQEEIMKIYNQKK